MEHTSIYYHHEERNQTCVLTYFLRGLHKSLIKQATNSFLFEGIAFKSLLYYYERREINTEKYNLQYSNNKEELL